MLEILALKIAVVAVVYILILQYESPFNRWWVFGEKHFKKWLLYRPLFVCEKCFAGQAAFWLYLFKKAVFLPHTPFVRFDGYIIGQHLYFVCFSILATFALSKIFNRLERFK